MGAVRTTAWSFSEARVTSDRPGDIMKLEDFLPPHLLNYGVTSLCFESFFVPRIRPSLDFVPKNRNFLDFRAFRDPGIV